MLDTINENKPMTGLQPGSLSEYLFDTCALTHAEVLLTKAPSELDLISWNLTQDTYKEQVRVAIDWILCEN